MNNENLVTAKAVLFKDGKWVFAVVPVCPNCGQRHVHGDVPADGDLREALGKRLSHCTRLRIQYVLVADSMVPQRFIKSRHGRS